MNKIKEYNTEDARNVISAVWESNILIQLFTNQYVFNMLRRDLK